jgi:hypothetical protein
MTASTSRTRQAGAQRPSWRSHVRRAAPLIALAVAAIAVAVIVTPTPRSGLPLDPASPDGAGTRALVEILGELGRETDVVAPDEMGDAPVVLLLRDQLTDDQRATLEQRVDDGTRLVVTDPESPIVPEVAGALSPLQPPLRRACDYDAVARTERIRPDGGALFEVPEDADGCFDSDDAAWLVVERRGRGEVVALGGPNFLINSQIDRADNAMLAVDLLAPGDGGRTEIVRPVLRSADDGASQTLGDLIPTGLRAALWQVLIGFVVLVAWKARRLGPPLEDRAPVRLASSDLTAAVGALLGRHDARAAALDQVAGATRRRLARRLDLPDAVDLDLLIERIATRTSLDPDTLSRTLQPAAPASDAALLGAVTALTDVERSVETQLASRLEESDVR